jgi:hypothetical protein
MLPTFKSQFYHLDYQESTATCILSPSFLQTLKARVLREGIGVKYAESFTCWRGLDVNYIAELR